jgi:hypothetical protein
MPRELVIEMIVLAAIGGLAVLLVLIDLADFVLVRAGKRSIFRPRPDRELLGLRFAAEGKDGPARHPQDLTG